MLADISKDDAQSMQEKILKHNVEGHVSKLWAIMTFILKWLGPLHNTTVKLFMLSNHAKYQEDLVVTYAWFQFNSPLIGKTDFLYFG